MAHMDCTRSVSCIVLPVGRTVYIVVHVMVKVAVYCVSITSINLVIGDEKYILFIYFY